MNKALLAKLAWVVVSRRDSLMANSGAVTIFGPIYSLYYLYDLCTCGNFCVCFRVNSRKDAEGS